MQGQSSEGEHHSTTRKQIEEEVLTTKCPRCSQAPPRSNPSHPERRRQPEIGIEAERDASPYSSTAVCWCAQAYHDFQGCTALACSRCSCQFCGWCLHDCGDSAHDCHEHVRACPERPGNADIFYPRPWSIFEQHWLTKKARKVREALRKRSEVLAIRCFHVWALAPGKIMLTACVQTTEDCEDTDDVLRELQTVCSYKFGIHHATFQVTRDKSLM